MPSASSLILLRKLSRLSCSNQCCCWVSRINRTQQLHFRSCQQQWLLSVLNEWSTNHRDSNSNHPGVLPSQLAYNPWTEIYRIHTNGDLSIANVVIFPYTVYIYIYPIYIYPSIYIYMYIYIHIPIYIYIYIPIYKLYIHMYIYIYIYTYSIL